MRISHPASAADLLQDFEDVYHSVNPDPASRAKVPIIIDDGATVIESLLTVEYLDAKYPNAGAKLFPDDPVQRFKVRFMLDKHSAWLNLLTTAGYLTHPHVFCHHECGGMLIVKLVLQVKLFIEAFTEHANVFSLLRASSQEQLDEAKTKLRSGLKVPAIPIILR